MLHPLDIYPSYLPIYIPKLHNNQKKLLSKIDPYEPQIGQNLWCQKLG
jgi:hypothetical protein